MLAPRLPAASCSLGIRPATGTRRASSAPTACPSSRWRWPTERRRVLPRPRTTTCRGCRGEARSGFDRNWTACRLTDEVEVATMDGPRAGTLNVIQQVGPAAGGSTSRLRLGLAQPFHRETRRRRATLFGATRAAGALGPERALLALLVALLGPAVPSAPDQRGGPGRQPGERPRRVPAALTVRVRRSKWRASMASSSLSGLRSNDGVDREPWEHRSLPMMTSVTTQH